MPGDRSWRRWTLRLAAASLLAFVAAAWPYRLLGGAASDRVERMGAELERTRARARAQQRLIAELRREIDALRNDPGAIEDIARRELGMIMPRELVLRFEPGEPPPPQPAPPPSPGTYIPAPAPAGAGL